MEDQKDHRHSNLHAAQEMKESEHGLKIRNTTDEATYKL